MFFLTHSLVVCLGGPVCFVHQACGGCVVWMGLCTCAEYYAYVMVWCVFSDVLPIYHIHHTHRSMQLLQCCPVCRESCAENDLRKNLILQQVRIQTQTYTQIYTSAPLHNMQARTRVPIHARTHTHATITTTTACRKSQVSMTYSRTPPPPSLPSVPASLHPSIPSSLPPFWSLGPHSHTPFLP